MSVSKWAYTPEKCDGGYCYGDCDNCPKANEDEIGDNSHKITNRELIEHCSKLSGDDCIKGGCKYKEICKKWKQKNEYAIPSDGRRFIPAMKPEWLNAEADEDESEDNKDESTICKQA